mmetsp:Transcript_12289/g.26438  ORF Transcript_12289/g.26438 Transcript_12289/m.26438 type:complete len:86 (+) Transcript_12289:439-696(+)
MDGKSQFIVATQVIFTPPSHSPTPFQRFAYICTHGNLLSLQYLDKSGMYRELHALAVVLDELKEMETSRVTTETAGRTTVTSAGG